jgi:hypothetical protein
LPFKGSHNSIHPQPPFCESRFVEYTARVPHVWP